MEQYPIPQFIESEGKIISFLTFRQFFVLVIGAGVCLGFFYVLPFFLFMILSAIVALLVLAIAFLKVDNVSMITIFFNFVTFSLASKNYVWKKKNVAMKNPVMGPVKSAGPMTADQSHLKNAKKMVEYRKKADTKK